MHAALDAGINFIDTANVYNAGQSEIVVGKALQGRRENVVLATKARGKMGEGPNEGGLSRRHLIAACEASLKRLNTDYIDLYQMHAPDTSTPIEETMGALNDVVKSGRVRYIGNSNYSGWMVVEAQLTAKNEHLTPFISAQNQYNLLDRRIERDLGQVAEKYGVGVLPYFPLANGFLTGKYRPGQPAPEGTRIAAMGQRAEGVLTEKNFEMLGKLEAFAEQRGHTMLDLAIGWLASHAWVGSVIAGATKPEQLEQNAKAGGWKLTAEEMMEVNAISRQ
jgi:aryl-alcohol dehydrogenase-like predicted oxidoreductase